ncbi:MAG: hypothetical protein H0Z39_02510 [Peptococcaceae bacterium]|nr:hypothetical protein [Peptococcaceae bacterium]
MPQELININYLKTLAGMVVAVNLLTQFFKGFIKKIFSDAAVRMAAWVFAIFIQFTVLYVDGQLGGSMKETAAVLVTGFLNSIVIALMATGAYEHITDPRARKEKPPAVIGRGKYFR